MGNTESRLKAGVNDVTGGLIAENMMSVLKTVILKQKVFRTIFRENIFVDQLPSYNETILPAWEFRFNRETVMGADLLHRGSINSRILFPNDLHGDVSFHRKMALTVYRFFAASDRLEDLLAPVSGLTEIGENIDIVYDTMFVQDGIAVPSIVMTIPFVLDRRRFRNENPEIPLDEDLDAALIREWEMRLEVTGVDETTETKKIVIPEGKL